MTHLLWVSLSQTSPAIHICTLVKTIIPSPPFRFAALSQNAEHNAVVRALVSAGRCVLGVIMFVTRRVTLRCRGCGPAAAGGAGVVSGGGHRVGCGARGGSARGVSPSAGQRHREGRPRRPLRHHAPAHPHRPKPALPGNPAPLHSCIQSAALTGEFPQPHKLQLPLVSFHVIQLLARLRGSSLAPGHLPKFIQPGGCPV